MLVCSDACILSLGERTRGVPPDGCPKAVEETENVEADDGFRKGARGILLRRFSLEGHVAASFGDWGAQKRPEARDGIHSAKTPRTVHRAARMLLVLGQRATGILLARSSITTSQDRFQRSLVFPPKEWLTQRRDSKNAHLSFSSHAAVSQSGSSTCAGAHIRPRLLLPSSPGFVQKWAVPAAARQVTYGALPYYRGPFRRA